RRACRSHAPGPTAPTPLRQHARAYGYRGLRASCFALPWRAAIDILFLDKYGNPYGRVWHGRPGSTTAIRRAQLRIADQNAGLQLAAGWMLEKLNNQIAFLEDARKRRTRLSAALTEQIEQLRAYPSQLEGLDGTMDEVRDRLMGLEGRAGRIYWKSINLLLPERFRFTSRSRNPAQDEFNCLLNYAYGVLYGTVDRACVLAGLDPYVGFIHTDNYNKPSLVFDLIERYRIWADQTVVGLFAARKITTELFDSLHKGLTLNKAGKGVLMERYELFLEEGIRHHGRNVKRRDAVQLDCHRIANDLIGRKDFSGT
ncbi:MAG: CRISPR-associated endonuclease Cas1, partial [Pseudomonadota bacterium]|nr:CRISPR-associated endonuclease Cas1 [Pseudomonadota bacterium]